MVTSDRRCIKSWRIHHLGRAQKSPLQSRGRPLSPPLAHFGEQHLILPLKPCDRLGSFHASLIADHGCNTTSNLSRLFLRKPFAGRTVWGNQPPPAEFGGMRRAPRGGRLVNRTSAHPGPDLAGVAPALGCTAGSDPHPARRCSGKTCGPRSSGRTTSLPCAAPPGGSGSHSCPSGTRSTWRCWTGAACSAACGGGPALPSPPHARYPSGGIDPAGRTVPFSRRDRQSLLGDSPPEAVDSL